MFPRPTPRRQYCRRHGREYDGYLCPECREEMGRKGSDSSVEKVGEAKRDTSLQESLDSILKAKRQESIGKEIPQKQVNKGVGSDGTAHTSNSSGIPKSSSKPKEGLGNLHEKGRFSRPPGKTETRIESKKYPPSKSPLPKWLFALLLVFILSITGLILNVYTGSPIPLWLLLGFSTIFSIQKWFRKATLNKAIGKLYRFVLNLGVLSMLGFLIWSGIQLFSRQLANTPLTGSLVFLAEFIFFVWLWGVVAKNSWRWPSMKLTIFSLICLSLVFTFAGVPPLSTYKDNLVANWTAYQIEQAVQQAEREAEQVVEQERRQAEWAVEEAVRLEEQERKEAVKVEAEARELALCNPSWAELKAFLLVDDTDKMRYVYPTTVCADFADKLQRNAKDAGWRCAVVSMRVTGYDDPFNYGIPSNTGHACNAFETTDRGLIYIDCTGSSSGIGPTHHDRIAQIEIGKKQTNQFIFPTEWIPVDNISIVVSVDVRW